MAIKPGNVVSHAAAQEWGAGKVLEVTADKATIQFSDGISRKIAASHFTSLQPANPASFSLPAAAAPAEKARAKTTKRKK